MLRTRIAPTPSGYLHFGNAFNFMLCWLVARKANGKVLLRIDDLDTARFRPAYLEEIFRTLEWLGISYDEGPSGPEDFLENHSQQTRLPLYQDALKQLESMDDPLFACALSRAKIRQMSEAGKYPASGVHQNLSLQAPGVAWRVKTPSGNPIQFYDEAMGLCEVDLFEEMRHFVIRRKDGIISYQLASLVDDIHYGINFIVRGQDLIQSTAAQCFLADKLDLSAFRACRFYHHPLIQHPTGEKLSKSAGANSIKAWRESGKTPVLFFQWVAKVIGLEAAGVRTSGDLLAQFEMNHLQQEFEVASGPEM